MPQRAGYWSKAQVKLLLVHGYFLKRDLQEQKVMKPYPPLGLLYLSASLKKAGHDVSVFDGTFADIPDFKRELDRFRPKVVGFYANMMTRHHVLALHELITDPHIVTVVGGPDPPHYAEDYLDRGFDAIIVGEGETALTQWLHSLLDQSQWETIPGLIYRADGQTVKNPSPKPTTPLDQFPFPDRGAIDLNLYLDCWEKHHGIRPISLITSRGCPFQCTWCSHNVYGYSLRKRSPENVLEEMAWLQAHYRFDSYWFADDVFTIQSRWIFQFREALSSHPELVKPFECISRADKLDPDIICALKALKCRRLWVGAESGSQRLLDLMKRGVKRNQVIEAVRNLRAAGIQSGMFFMWGFMDESLEDVLETVSLAEACEPDIALTTVAYPIRGTRFFQSLEAKGALAPALPFDQGTDRDLGIETQADPALYHLANRYLHLRLGAVRLSRGSAIQRLKGLLQTLRGRLVLNKLSTGFADHITELNQKKTQETVTQ